MNAEHDQSDGPTPECADDIRLQTEFLQFRTDAFLRKKGWKSTSKTPGCYWLWEKTLEDGRIILVNRSIAVSMQGYFESLEEAKSDD